METTEVASAGFAPRTDQRDRALLVVVVLVAAAAWVAMSLGPGAHGGHIDVVDVADVADPATPLDHGTHHHHVDTSGHVHHDVEHARDGSADTPRAGSVPVLASGWLLMVVAMMLPPALPLLSALRRLVIGRRRPTLLVVAGTASFVSVWALAGLGFWLGDLGLDRLVGSVPSLAAHPELLAGGAAVAAGLYQFTPAKSACLRACRSPRSVALAAWSGRRPAAVEAADIGVRYGAICVGCCWALMLLTFTVGTAALAVMVVLSAVMLLERLVPSTRVLVPAVALGAIALGVAILAGVLPPGLVQGASA